MAFPVSTFPLDAPNVSESTADKHIIGTYLNNGLVPAVNDLDTRLQSLTARVAVLESALGPVTVLDITAAQEAILLGAPLGSLVELRGPSNTTTLTVSG